MKFLSIMTPCYNEEAGIERCYEAIREIISTQLPELRYEHVFIDNCSTDATVAKLRAIAARDPAVKIIVNARNFGPARSGFHGFLQTSGDAVIPVVADLQTPPSLIPELVRQWQAGKKVVLAVKRSSAPESFVLRQCRRLYYDLMQRFSKVEHLPGFEGYGLYDRQVVEVIRSLREPEPYFRGLIMEVGFERTIIWYDQEPRRSGKSSYNIYSLTDFALLGMSISTRVPLRMMTLIGFVVAMASLVVGFIYLGLKLAFWYSLPVGVAPVVIAVFFLGAVQLFALGIIGEYIGLLLNYARNFPLVIERERINFPTPRFDNAERRLGLTSLSSSESPDVTSNLKNSVHPEGAQH
jgi:glycosyltransferase involved in cell wall biosynthesis